MTHSQPRLRSGFSLVELMIYMAVVGLLAMVVVPNFMSYLETGRRSATEQNIKAVKQAITTFYSDTGSYPDSLRELGTKPLDERTAKGWHGPYLEDGKMSEDGIPLDGWKHELVYRRVDPSSGKAYELYSYGKGGEDGADEDRIYAQ